MKLLQTVQMCFHNQFIYLNSNRGNRLLSWKNVVVILLLAQMGLQTLAFSIFQAKTHIELGNSFYMFATAFNNFNAYLVYIKKRHDIQIFIEKLEQFMENGKQDFVFLKSLNVKNQMEYRSIYILLFK